MTLTVVALVAVFLGYAAVMLGIWALLYAHGDRERNN